MDRFAYDPERMKVAIRNGGRSDLRFACECADQIVAAVTRSKDEETLEVGYGAFRARNGYHEEEDAESHQPNTYPLAGTEMSAPPKEITRLGRFNPPLNPALYLSTTREVALAEVRALSSDTCTVAVFKTVKPVRIARLLRLGSPLGALFNETPSQADLDAWLLSQTAKFVSRRVEDDVRDLHYRTCNLIASAFKESGFDGLVYRTSFWSPGWR